MVLSRRSAIVGAPLLPLSARAQGRRMAEPPPVAFPALPKQAPDAAGFVPPGWELEDSAAGDLDGDGRSDLAMVFRMRDPSNVLDNPGLGERRLDTNPRLLAVAFAAPYGYRLVVQDHALIPRRVNPVLEDPFAKGLLAIERGAFRLALSHWASAGSYVAEVRTLTFRWQNGRFELIGFESSVTHRATGEVKAISVNYSTRRAIFSEGRIDADDRKERRVTLPSRPAVALGSVGDGLAFDPGVPD